MEAEKPSTSACMEAMENVDQPTLPLGNVRTYMEEAIYIIQKVDEGISHEGLYIISMIYSILDFNTVIIDSDNWIRLYCHRVWLVKRNVL